MSYSDEWFTLQNQISYFQSRHSFVWFRGHSKSNTYTLDSGLFRDDLIDLDLYLEDELQRYQEFSNLGHIDHGKSDWELLYIMQHHGVKTRLLDWTESFVTALFFSYLNWQPDVEDACVWMLNPKELNELSLGSAGLHIPNEGKYEQFIYAQEEFQKNSIALYPVRNNKRIVAQQGVFTLQGNSMLPLDQEWDGDLVANGSLVKLNLSKDLLEDIQCFLKLSGVNHYTMFPDLDGLARYVNIPFLERPLGMK